MVEVARLSKCVGYGLIVLSVSCRPDLEGRPSLIDESKVIALRSMPAEAAPGDAVRYEALVASPNAQELDVKSLYWQSCSLRKPLTTSGAIDPECLNNGGSEIIALGRGLEVASTVDEEACQLFGPTPPDPEAGEPALRAADPDTTGGYYRPIVLRQATGREDDYSVGVTRLFCGIGNAPQEQVISFNQHYRRNENPRLEVIRIDDGHNERTLQLDNVTASSLSVKVNSAVHLEVVWPTCPRSGDCGDYICSVDETVDDCEKDCTKNVGCYGAETYLLFAPDSRSLIQKREQLRVSWYATSGKLDHDRTGANVPGDADSSSNDWTAPSTEGTTRFWVVVRDDRRGVGWQAFDLTVEK